MSAATMRSQETVKVRISINDGAKTIPLRLQAEARPQQPFREWVASTEEDRQGRRMEELGAAGSHVRVDLSWDARKTLR